MTGTRTSLPPATAVGARERPHPLPLVVEIREDVDVAIARVRAREVGRQEGLSQVRVEALATAVSEIARNTHVHGGGGDISFAVAAGPGCAVLVAEARDFGPGIADPERALADGFSTRGGLGLGLPSARRLVDDFRLDSRVGKGTTVTMHMRL